MVTLKRRLLLLAAALGVWGLLLLLAPQSLQLADERGTDLVWRLTQEPAPERRIIMVDIDDESLSRIGPWPWNHATLAQLVSKLDNAGAALKLLDITFPQAREGTVALDQALTTPTAAPSVLGQVFALRNESVLQIGQPSTTLPARGCLPMSVPAQGVIANTAQLHAPAGHISATIDTDGYIRKIPAIVCYAGRNYPALSTTGLTQLGHASAPMRIEPGHGLLAPAWLVHFDALPGLPVALDATGHLRIPYRQARSAYTAISASDVLNDKAPAGLLSGAIVLIGATAFGLSDVVTTALGPAVGGTEVHAQLLSGMLDGRVPSTPQGAWLFQLAGAGALCLALLSLGSADLLQRRRRVVLLPLLALASVSLLWAAHGLALWAFNLQIPWMPPALLVLVLGTLMSVDEHLRSLHAKERLYGNLASFIPRPVARKVALTIPSSDIEAQRSQVAVLSADIRNFSAYCETRSPEDTARVLHRFYKTASEIVSEHGGMVVEMVGDSLLAVFGAQDNPEQTALHTRQALLAARHIWLRCGEDLPNTAGQGLEPLAIGIGIEFGTTLLGNFGAADRRVHTVLGRTVTIALRLGELTSDLAYPILIGAKAATLVEPRLDEPDLALKSLGSFLLPGLTESNKVFTLITLLKADSEQEQQTMDILQLLKPSH